MNQFNLVNTPQEISKFTKILSVQLDEEGRRFLDIYEDYDFLVLYSIIKTNVGHEDIEYQSELPIKSISWIKDVIVNGFWRKPTDGGLPKAQHAVKCVIDDEEIIVSRTMNAEYGKPGFKIVNKSRNSYIMKSQSQNLQITDELLKSYLLDIFDKYLVS